MEKKEEGCCCCQECKLLHPKMVPVLIFLLGLTFFLGSVNVLSSGAVQVLWPVLLMLIGVQKFFRASCSCCGGGSCSCGCGCGCGPDCDCGCQGEEGKQGSGQRKQPCCGGKAAADAAEDPHGGCC